MTDFARQASDKLDTISSTEDFCKDWTNIYRCLAVAAQAILTTFFPAGAKVLGYLIKVADEACPKPKS